MSLPFDLLPGFWDSRSLRRSDVILGFIISTLLYFGVMMVLLGERRPLRIYRLQRGYRTGGIRIFQFILDVPIPDSGNNHGKSGAFFRSSFDWFNLAILMTGVSPGFNSARCRD
jgi:hypothetical protein